jgi:hypothetical protein
MIASAILYECCVAAKNVLGMSQVVGNLGTRFRVMKEARSAVHNLRPGGSRRVLFLAV